MVGVLVRDEDGIDLFRVFSDGLQPLSDLAEAEADIDQKTYAIGSYQRRVSAAAAS